MATLLEAELEKQIAEIIRIRSDTEAGRIEWTKPTDMICTYYSQINERLRCELQCCGSCVLKLNDQIVKVPQDLLNCLCETIKYEIALREAQEVTQSLQLIKPHSI